MWGSGPRLWVKASLGSQCPWSISHLVASGQQETGDVRLLNIVNVIHSFILFCSSNQQSQAVGLTIPAKLESKATKHRQLPKCVTR